MSIRYNKYPVIIYICEDKTTKIIFPGLSDPKPYHELDSTISITDLCGFVTDELVEILETYDQLPIPLQTEFNLAEIASDRRITGIMESFLFYFEYGEGNL